MGKPKKQKDKLKVAPKSVTKKDVKDTVKDIESDYLVSLTCGNEKYEGSGASIIDAFQSLPRLPKVIQKGVLVVSHNGKTQQHYLYPNQVRKVMGFKISRAIWAKLFSYGI